MSMDIYKAIERLQNDPSKENLEALKTWIIHYHGKAAYIGFIIVMEYFFITEELEQFFNQEREVFKNV